MVRDLFVLGLLAGAACAQVRTSPDFADVKYGPHERNVLDFWRAKAAAPAPLVLYIHGGGFRGGDKKSLSPARLKQYLDAGFAVAAFNYRLTDTAPFPAQYRDCGARPPVRPVAREGVEHRPRAGGLNGRFGRGRNVDVACVPRRPGGTGQPGPGRAAIYTPHLRGGGKRPVVLRSTVCRKDRNPAAEFRSPPFLPAFLRHQGGRDRHP